MYQLPCVQYVQRVVQSVASIFLYYVYVTKYWLFDSFQIKKTKCSHGTFLSHLDIIIVTVDCQFTATSVSLLRHVCPLRVAGAKGSD